MLDLTRRRTRRPIARSSTLLLAFLLLLATGLDGAGPQPLDAAQVKAAFVMNFLKFVDWPPSHLEPAPAPLVVAVIGDRAFVDVLQRTAAGESISGHPVVVKAVEQAGDARGAHLLFISASEGANLPLILKTIEASALLTVGDTDGFARAGVILNLYTFDQRIRIEVNTTAAARAGLRLSAHLLRIARIVG